MKGREDATFMVRHVIGNGENTTVWLDPWHHRQLLKDHFPYQLLYSSDCNLKTKVSELIIDGRWAIPNALARTAPYIQAITEDTEYHGGEDFVVYAPTQQGNYTLADTSFCEGRSVHGKWSKLVWFKERILRHAFITWIALTLEKMKN